ncbi:MAG: citrate lyase acyl carrier protein [Thermoplasmata archaeon]|nr:citrate lyase acyl carrier protein [Thermoplasmata archaeon]
MKIEKEVTVGTEEREDVLLTLKPNPEGGIKINITGKGAEQFGEEIRSAAMSVLKEMNVENAIVEIKDNWAFDYAIRARTRAAVLAAKGEV